MDSTPLHTLRARLEALASLVDADECENVLALADDPDEVAALTLLFAAADRQLTDKANPPHQYTAHVRTLLGGESWAWHLADGGYSRITVSLVDGPANVLNIDLGLSLDKPIARWDSTRGGRK